LRHEVAGYAALVVPAAALGQAAGNIPLLLGSIFIGVFILTLLSGIFVTRGITRPLANLVRATREVGAGNLQYQAPVISADEVGALTESFNDMTRTLFQQQLERDLQTEATVQTLAATIDARDRFTHGHSLRVAAYSKEMARAAGFVGTDVDVVRRGCLVHDIGKIGIPDAILGKPGPLTDDERTLMQHHPEIGYQMLRHLEWPHGVMDIVLYHHERWDGEGYPSRLAGENIPLLARLVGVSDTLDAMTSDRPYRKGFTFDRAADEIRNNAGKQFDPAMVAVFEKIEVVLKQMVQELQNPARPADLRELTRALAS
jgi:putative nucleotidyltransferase with HDIG domain